MPRHLRMYDLPDDLASYIATIGDDEDRGELACVGYQVAEHPGFSNYNVMSKKVVCCVLFYRF